MPPKSAELEAASENIKVACRVRPLSSKEVNEGFKSVVHCDHATKSIALTGIQAGGKDRYTFDHVIDDSFSQSDIFDQIITPMCDALLEGYNATVFAYGQSGSGKTHTMTGAPTPDLEGVSPRAFKYVLKRVEEQRLVGGTNKLWRIACSFLELYNNRPRDLLSDNPEKDLKIKEDRQKHFFVNDLTRQEVTNMHDLMECMRIGTARRKVEATELNAVSSRSHSLFTVYLELTESLDDGTKRLVTSKLNLVDLAGSERQEKTKAEGDRLKEGSNINLSLSALGTVIDALVKVLPHIPFRSSPLTMLLKDSLGGGSKTLMFANMGPSEHNLSETVSTLRFADRAKQIKNKPQLQMDAKDLRIKLLEDQVEQLKARLAIYEKGDGMVAIDDLRERHEQQLAEVQATSGRVRAEMEEEAFKATQAAAVAAARIEELTALLKERDSEIEEARLASSMAGIDKPIGDDVGIQCELAVAAPPGAAGLAASTVGAAAPSPAVAQADANLAASAHTAAVAAAEAAAARTRADDLVASAEQEFKVAKKQFTVDKKNLTAQLKELRDGDASGMSEEQRQERDRMIADAEAKLANIKQLFQEKSNAIAERVKDATSSAADAEAAAETAAAETATAAAAVATLSASNVAPASPTSPLGKTPSAPAATLPLSAPPSYYSDAPEVPAAPPGPSELEVELQERLLAQKKIEGELMDRIQLQKESLDKSMAMLQKRREAEQELHQQVAKLREDLAAADRTRQAELSVQMEDMMRRNNASLKDLAERHRQQVANILREAADTKQAIARQLDFAKAAESRALEMRDEAIMEMQQYQMALEEAKERMIRMRRGNNDADRVDVASQRIADTIEEERKKQRMAVLSGTHAAAIAHDSNMDARAARMLAEPARDSRQQRGPSSSAPPGYGMPRGPPGLSAAVAPTMSAGGNGGRPPMPRGPPQSKEELTDDYDIPHMGRRKF